MRQVDMRDQARCERITAALRKAGLDAVVCALPTNVLLVTGYWPVVGTALAIATSDGRVVVIAPEDEMDPAGRSVADQVVAYSPASLDATDSVTDAVREPLRRAAKDLRIEQARIGYERGPVSEPVS